MMALQGIRVLDLGMVWAAPYCVRLLADMGAEVIKIESMRRYDSVRGAKNPPPGVGLYLDREPGERPYNRESYFNERNRNKMGITIDMTQPRGIELFKRLLKISDVVVENYATGVTRRWGIGYEQMRAVREDIIYLSMPAFGNTGPEGKYVGYGVSVEQMAGIGAITGYLDGVPMRAGINYTDPLASMHAAGAILAALYYRAETGKGQFIDLSHRESAVTVVGEAFMDWTMNNRIRRPAANQHASMAPHGVYPCSGSDIWVAIAVKDDEDWRRLRAAMGDPPWAQDQRFEDGLERWRHREELDVRIAEWTRDKDHYDVADLLQAVGIAAGPVLVNWEMLDDPQFVAREWFVVQEHREAGVVDYPGIAWKMSDTPGSVFLSAPCFAEHNKEVFAGLLGLDEAEIASLAEEGIIGDEPA